VPHVLIVTTLELRHPVTLLVLMKTDDAPLRGHSSASFGLDPRQCGSRQPMCIRELSLPFLFGGCQWSPTDHGVCL